MNNFTRFTRILFVALCMMNPASFKAQEISPYLLGNNAWLDTSILNDLWDDMALAGFQTIRIGGAGAEGYSATSAKYLTLLNGIQLTGAQPIVQVPRYYTTQQVKDLYTKINITNGKNVKLWSIGNEPDHANRPSPPDSVARYIRRISSALKSMNPDIKILGPDLASFNTTTLDRYMGGDLDISGADANGNYYLDVFTWHRYMFVKPNGLESYVNQFYKRADIINVNRPAGKKMSWGLPEFNTSYDNNKNTFGPDQLVWSFAAGQFIAETYEVGMRRGATVMNVWSMLEGSSNRANTDLSIFDTDLKGRSSYYHSLMLGQNMKKNYATSTVNNDSVSIIGMKDETGISVMILNKSKLNGYDYTLKLNTSVISPVNTLNINVNAGITGTNQQLSGYIPSAATQMLSFDATGTLIKRYIYTAIDAYDRKGPIIQTAFCNNPPSINIIPKQIKIIDKGLFSVNLNGITDGDKCSQGVTVSAVSSNPDIVSVNAVNYTSCSKTGTLDLLPKADGEVTITVSVTEMPHSCSPLTTTTSFIVRAYNPITIPGKVEAENYIDMTGIQTQTTTDTNGGLNVGYIDQYDWMDYGVRVEKTGTYDVNFRLASFPTTGQGAFELKNGGTTLSTVSVTNTGGWQTWNTQTAKVNLTAGDQILRINITASGLNLNWIDFEETKTASQEITGTKNEIKVFQSANNVVFDLNQVESDKDESNFRIINMAGQIILNEKINSNNKTISFNKNHFKPGIYIVSCQTNTENTIKKFVIY